MRQKHWFAYGAGVVVMTGIMLPIEIHPPRNPVGDPARKLEAVVTVPGDMHRMLKRACYDCHSNQTRWPWYSKIPPGYWVIPRDVEHARRAMNFSELPDSGSAPEQYAAGMLMASCTAMRSGEMPHPRYLLLHPEAKLSKDDVEQFCTWSMLEATRLMAASHGAGTAGGSAAR